ncbi:MAG: hypothetical protein NVSMB39_7510 [Candidatus Saccharimonadales bacterium]
MAPSALSNSAPTPSMMPKQRRTARNAGKPYTTVSVAKPGAAQPNKVSPIKLSEPEHRRNGKAAAKLVPSPEPRSTVVPDKVVSHTVKRGVAVAAYILFNGKYYHTLLNPATGFFEAKSLTMTQFDLRSLMKVETKSESASEAPSQNRHVKKAPVATPKPAPKQGKKKRR